MSAEGQGLMRYNVDGIGEACSHMSGCSEEQFGRGILDICLDITV